MIFLRINWPKSTVRTIQTLRCGEWQLSVVERQTQVVERRSSPFQLNLITGNRTTSAATRHVLWAVNTSRMRLQRSVFRAQEMFLVVAANVCWKELTALPKSLGWIWGVTSRWEKKRGKGTEMDGRNSPWNKFLVTALMMHDQPWFLKEIVQYGCVSWCMQSSYYWRSNERRCLSNLAA